MQRPMLAAILKLSPDVHQELHAKHPVTHSFSRDTRFAKVGNPPLCISPDGQENDLWSNLVFFSFKHDTVCDHRRSFTM
jgi:hypothetical protein